MTSREALLKIFHNPRAVFVAQKGRRKWVPAVVFMVALLAIHGVIVSIGTHPPTRIGESIAIQSPVTYSQIDSAEGGIAAEGDESEQSDPVHSDDAPTLDSNERQVGSFILWLSFAIASLPFMFGFLCLISLLEAVYFRIVSALLNYEFTFGDWFVLSVWSRVPGITLSVVALMVAVLVMGRQPESEALEVLRLTRWIELPEVKYSGSNWSISTDFDHLGAHLLWIIALQTIGFSEWTGKNIAFSFGIAVLPTLVLIAITCAAILAF